MRAHPFKTLHLGLTEVAHSLLVLYGGGRLPLERLPELGRNQAQVLIGCRQLGESRIATLRHLYTCITSVMGTSGPRAPWDLVVNAQLCWVEEREACGELVFECLVALEPDVLA